VAASRIDESQYMSILPWGSEPFSVTPAAATASGDGLRGATRGSMFAVVVDVQVHYAIVYLPNNLSDLTVFCFSSYLALPPTTL
jgi:hypothetical protein